MNDLTSADANIQSAMLDVVSESISGAFLVYDRTDLITFASPQLRNFFPGVSPAPRTRMRDFFGLVHDCMPTPGKDSVNRPHRSPVRREDWVAEQISSLWKERSETLERRGSERWISYTTRRLPSGFGVCIIRDVSETKKREDQWRADLERVQVTEDILDNLPLPVLVKDRNFQFVGVNKAACDLYGLPANAILGRRLSDLHASDLVERLDDSARQVMETGIQIVAAERMIRADGREASIVTSKYRIGKPGRYFVVTIIQDISALAETDFITDHIEAAPNLDFSPAGMNEACTRGRRMPSLPAAIPADMRLLVATADDTLAASSLNVLHQAALDCSRVRSAAELEIFLDIAADARVGVDLVLVDSCMDMRCIETAAQYGISVLVLESFQLRADLIASIERYLGEAGYADAQTDIEVDDEDWQISGQAPIDVLVAEDNEVNQIVFSQILDGLGYRYAIATDGAEAVRLWQEQSPRIVLMDITLPKLNGFEATRRIRELEVERGTTTIIGVLQPAFENDRQACDECGMDAVIVKPVSSDAVETAFRAFGLGTMDDNTASNYL